MLLPRGNFFAARKDLRAVSRTPGDGIYRFPRGKRSAVAVVNDSPVDCQSRDRGAPQRTAVSAS